MENIIEALEWRYATKVFDKTSKLTDKQVNDLKRVCQLSASSFGLQPYKIIVISNSELMEQLKPASYGQAQITDSSHLFLFCAMKGFNKKDVDAFVNRNVEITGVDKAHLKNFHEMMDMKMDSMNESENLMWATKQAYIALGNLLTAAAVMKIDTCPIEGFIPEQYSEILKLDKMGLEPLVLAAVGYRDASDKYQNTPKVRKKMNDLFIDL